MRNNDQGLLKKSIVSLLRIMWPERSLRATYQWALFDRQGARKYLTAAERASFCAAARKCSPKFKTFYLALAYTGARISEILALTPERVDQNAGIVIVETLKKRRRGVYRAIPVPDSLFIELEEAHGLTALQSDQCKRKDRLWSWSRTTAWTHVKEVMRGVGIHESRAMPKSLRHAFGVCGTTAHVPLNLIQRWMGHSRIETTAIYADAVGAEERDLARLMWSQLEDNSAKNG